MKKLTIMGAAILATVSATAPAKADAVVITASCAASVACAAVMAPLAILGHEIKQGLNGKPMFGPGNEIRRFLQFGPKNEVRKIVRKIFGRRR